MGLSWGFTLIELLVVIAIIGVLASIILASLSSARSKGNDSRVISDVRELRALFESERNPTNYASSFNPVYAGGTGLSAAIVSSNNSVGLNLILNDASKSAPTGYSASTTIGSNASGGGGTNEIVVFTDGVVNSGIWSTLPTMYSIWGRLSSGNYFCIDSTGNTKSGTINIPAHGVGTPVCQ